MRNYCMNCMMPLGEQDQSCPHCGYSNDGSVIAHQLRPGTLLSGRYLVGKAIGQGGFGITYIGRDTKLDRKIAVKEYYPTGYANRNSLISSAITITDKDQLSFIEDGKKKFLKEAKTLAQFSDNSGIVNIYEHFEENRTAYIVMEYLDGQDLRSRLKESLFPTDEIFKLMAPIFDALEKIHEKKMIHRDISPDNIMMLKNGTLKLMDFGAARQVNFSDQKSISVVLKAGFAPEEQYRSKGIQGPWTDIYALCATIYKCITGITPDDSLQRSNKDEIRWPSELGISITVRQEAVLKKGLALKQQDRFQNIGEMKAALSGDADSPIQAIDLSTDGDGESDNDRTVYHPHGGQKNEDEEDSTEYHHRDSGRKELPSDEDDATEYRPHDRRGKELPNDGEGESADEAVERDQPEPEKDSEADVSGGRKKRKFMIAGICAAVIVAVVIAVAALRGGSGADQESGPTDVQGVNVADAVDVTVEPSVEPLSELDYSSMYHITLTIDDEVTVREFNEALPILTERLNLFTDEEPYEMTVEDNFIVLYLPKDAFGDKDVEETLKVLITSAADFYLFDISTNSDDSEPAIEALSRDDLESVTLMEGAIDGVNATEYDIDTPTYQYIEVTLTDQYAQQYSQEIAEWGENLTLAQDDATYYNTFPAGNGKTFYILIKTQRFTKVVEYNMTHPPLPFSFGITTDLNSKVEWQGRDAALIAGENQCEASELTGDTVTVLFTHYTNDLSEGELLDLETSLKARLDCLEQPYAYGTVEDPDKYFIAVKTGLEHMGEPTMDLLCAYSPNLMANYVSTGLLTVEALTWEKDADGMYSVTLNVKQSYNNDLTKLSGWMTEQGGGKLYLSNSIHPLLSTDIDRYIEDGTVTFRNICFDGRGDDANIIDEDVWFLRLMEHVCCGKPKSSIGISYADAQMNLENGVMTLNESRYGVSYDYLEIENIVENIRNAISSAVPDADVTFYDRYISVFLNLEDNENLPEIATAMAKYIYEVSGFESNVCPQIGVYFINEDDEIHERGRILFYKGYGRINSGDETVTNGYSYASGVFYNGRMEKYKEKIKNIVETDPFYTSLTIEGNSQWKFEQ